MRQVILSLFIVLVAMPMAANDVTTPVDAEQEASNVISPLPPTIRKGEKYMVGQDAMNARAYRGYLKNTCPEAFDQFDKGYKTAMAGWGLFAGGPVLAVGIGFPIAFIGGFAGSAYPPNERPASVRRTGIAMRTIGYSFVAIGGAAFLASFPCLGVGYSKMHGASRLYNTSCAKQPTAYWTLQTLGSDVGIALHF